MSKDIKISMIGCGKLGLPCAEMMAEKFEVMGYDIVPFASDTVSIAPDIKSAVNFANVIFVAVPTPHDKLYGGERPTSGLPTKDFDYSIVQNVLIEANKYLTNDKLLVLISTCLPGTVRNKLAPLITNGKFIYSPYLIAMGSVKWDMVNPEMVIIGTKTGVS